MTNDENSNHNVFCVPAKYAKQEWYFTTQQLQSLKYEKKGGRYYGGCFHLYKPADLDALADEIHGKGRVAKWREAREAEHKKEVERERELERERERKLQEEAAKKKRRDAMERERPKSAVYANVHYRRHRRPEMIKKYPNMFMKDINSMITKEYRELSCKKTWQDKAKADKARYNKECEAFKKKFNVEHVY